MRASLVLVGFLMFFFTAVAVQGAGSNAAAFLNLDKSGLVLSGYDPVSYHTGTPVKGTKKFLLSYGGATYSFSDKINPKTFKIINGKTYLYYHTFFVNTLTKWNKRAEKRGMFTYKTV